MTTSAISGVPMYFPPAGFDLDLAVTCAELVDAAYGMEKQWITEGKPKPGAFQWQGMGNEYACSSPIWGESRSFAFMERNEPFGFVARRGTQTFLIIRGTAGLPDMVEDLKAHQVAFNVPGLGAFGLVHEGFLQIWESMRDAVLEALGTPPTPAGQLIVAGHSLGSSLTTLAFPDVLANSGYQVPDWHVTQYNLASPRTGDAAFAAHYNALAAAQDWQNAVTYRIVSTTDVVPESPPSELFRHHYQHVGIPVDFTAQYGSVVGNHSCKDTYLYALQNPQSPINPNRLMKP